MRHASTSTASKSWLALAALALLVIAASAASYAADPRDAGPRGRGEVLDNRYNHGHYYPPSGAVVRALPGGYRPYYYRGSRFYFSGGIWYAPGPYGFVVTPAPGRMYLLVLTP